MYLTTPTATASPGPAPLAGKPSPLVYEHLGPTGLEGRLRIDVADQAFRRSTELVRGPHTVLLGMSPGNGYFTKKRVEIAVAAFAQLSGNVAVIVPDAISIHTYRALGYSESDCRAHVKKHGQHLKNRAQRAIELSAVQTPGARVRQLDWNRDVASIPGFVDARARLERLVEHDPRFRHDVLGVARTVIEGKRQGAGATEAAVREAANYLLSEFAFIRVCRSLLGERVVVPYHKPFPLAADLAAGVYGESIPGVSWPTYEIEILGGDELAAGGSHAH